MKEEGDAKEMSEKVTVEERRTVAVQKPKPTVALNALQLVYGM